VWQQSKGFKKVVKKAWEAPTSCGNNLKGTKVKLKSLKREIKH